MSLGGPLEEGGGGIGIVQREEAWRTKQGGASKEIQAVEEVQGWEKIRVQVDSGAIDTVGPKEVGRQFVTKETRASKQGIGYEAANGTKIRNYGEKVVEGWTDEGAPVSMAIQVADVKKTLGSVYRMNQAGNQVVLDGGFSYMIHKKTGKRTPILEEHGQYVFYIWTKKGSDKGAAEVKPTGAATGSKHSLGNNRYAALVEEEEAEQVFSWQGEMF